MRQKLLLRSVHPRALSLWNLFYGAGGGGNLLRGAQNEVHCSQQNHLFGPGQLFSMWVLNEIRQWGNSFRAGWKNAVVKVGVIDMIQIKVFYSYLFKLKEIGQWVRCSRRGFTLFKDMNQYRFFKPVPVRAQQAGFPITQSKLFSLCALIWSCFLSLVTSVLT